MSEQNGGSAQPLSGGSDEVAPAPAAPVATVAQNPVVPVPVKQERSYRSRFTLIYGVLVVILAGAVAGIFASGVVSHKSSVPSGWSSWKPAAGSTASVTKQIADHVAKEYKLDKSGAQLVGIVAQAPSFTSGTHKILISNLAIKTKAKTGKGKDIQIVPSTSMWTDELCGIGGTQCSIPGKPSTTRGQLVRREALEVALYTFKYVPSVNSVVAFMPPPKGAQPTLLFLQRSSLTKQLAQPLSKTLPLATPPLPSEPDLKEKATIDGLTLPALYSYTLQQLQDASALLVLNHFQS